MILLYLFIFLLQTVRSDEVHFAQPVQGSFQDRFDRLLERMPKGGAGVIHEGRRGNESVAPLSDQEAEAEKVARPSRTVSNCKLSVSELSLATPGLRRKRFASLLWDSVGLSATESVTVQYSLDGQTLIDGDSVFASSGHYEFVIPLDFDWTKTLVFRLVDDDGNFSNFASLRVEPDEPEIPQLLSANYREVKWKGFVLPQTGDRVSVEVRASAGALFNEVARVDQKIKSQALPPLTPAAGLAVRLRACNQAICSPYGQETELATEELAQSSLVLSAKRLDAKAASLSWTWNGTAAVSGFEVELSSGGLDHFNQVALAPGNARGVDRLKLENNSLYFVRVRAQLTASFSGYSNIVKLAVDGVAPSLEFNPPIINATFGVSLAPVVPKLTGTQPMNCTASPALPFGITLGAACEISGTPFMVPGTAIYQITARNSVGKATQSVTLAVNSNGATYSFVGGDKSAQSGGTITLALPPGVAAGDFMIISLARPMGAPILPAGWTQENDNCNRVCLTNYTRTAGGSEAPQVTLSLNGTGAIGVLRVYRSTLIHAYRWTNVVNSGINSPSVDSGLLNASKPYSISITSFAADSQTGRILPPPGGTERAVYDPEFDPPSYMLEVSDEPVLAAGLTPKRTVTSASGEPLNWVSHSAVIITEP